MSNLALCLILITIIRAPDLFAQESAPNRGNLRLESETEPTTENVLIPDLNIEVDDEDDEGGDASTNGEHFTYKNHVDDHGIYSGRSLSSSKNIKPPIELNELEIENESRKYDDEMSALNTVDYAEKEWQLMFRSFDLSQDSMMTSVLQELGKRTNLFEDIVSRLPYNCRRDIYHIKESVKKHRLWALRMLDSNGKLPSGLIYGRFASPGDYEECLSVRVNDRIYSGQSANGKEIIDEYKFNGKYCLIDFRLPMPERPQDKMLSIHEPVLNFTGTDLQREYPDFVQNYSAYLSVFYEIGYMHAFCLPSTCRVEDITKSFGKSFEGMYLIVNNTIDCEEWQEQGEPLRRSQVIALSIMIIVIVNGLIASLFYQLQMNSKLKYRNKTDKTPLTKNDDDSTPTNKSNFMHRLIKLSINNEFYASCFSVQKNFERLSKPDPRGLTFVHYTRIVAMAMTVITHTAALGTLQAITKPADASNSEQIFRDFLPQMLANAFTSIQIFFFMAGFMLVISTYPSIQRDKGNMSFLEYAIKRAIRLMPGLGAAICLNFLWPLIVDGPMLKYFVRVIVIPCESNWWHTLGFLSNFEHVEKMCLRHSYFSASDYQLHIIAFPLLVLLYKKPMFSMLIAAILTLGGFVAQVIMVLTKNVLPFMMVDYIDKEAFFNVIHYIHHPVWNHMSAFFYGFIVGYLVVRKIRINLSERTTKMIWYTLMPIGLLSIFAPYFWNHYKRPIHRWQTVLYVIIDRFVLLTTCAWISYASMVLARPVQRKKTSASSGANHQENKPNTGLSIIAQASPVTQETKFQKIAIFETGQPKQDSRSVEQCQQDGEQQLTNGHLKPNLSTNFMPRQQSSLNLVNEPSQQPTQANRPTSLFDPALPEARMLSRTISGSNLATISESIPSGAASNNASDPSKALHQFGPATKPTQSDTQPERSRNSPPVSNINTLCLILSRLTFQLYLFNMVVLWVDVNHSKYYWFFSYYFIIVKAAAVYVTSAIIAVVFFVLLESPSLTLYIAWVRTRAASRAQQSHTKAPKIQVEPIVKSSRVVAPNVPS